MTGPNQGNRGDYGYPGGLQPPVRKSRSSGCLIWGVVGCGILALCGIGGFVVLLISASKMTAMSGMRKMVSNAMAIQSCVQKIAAIDGALGNYRSDHAGKYPNSLSELVPKYVPQSDTTCGDAGDGHGSPLQYTPPRANAPDDTPIVTFATEPTSFGQIPSKTTHGQAQMTQLNYIRLLKDGRIQQDQVTRTEFEPSASGQPSNQAPK